MEGLGLIIAVEGNGHSLGVSGNERRQWRDGSHMEYQDFEQSFLASRNQIGLWVREHWLSVHVFYDVSLNGCL